MVNKEPHKNHRKRMQDRALKEGFSSFSDFQLLEYALFFSRPRIDTNPLAHELMEEFGSIKGILEARVGEICRVDGVGPTSALFFQMLTELMRRYERDMQEKTFLYNSIQSVATYLNSYFVGINVERLYAMFFNNRMKLIDFVLISEGNVNCTEASLRKISEHALNKNATSVILAHNHPQGVAYPSQADIGATSTVENFLNTINVTLVEHLIFNDRRYYPIMLNHFSRFRPSPHTGKTEPSFYDKFYQGINRSGTIAPLFMENAEKNEEKQEN